MDKVELSKLTRDNQLISQCAYRDRQYLWQSGRFVGNS
jgi:hypothetical protein